MRWRVVGPSRIGAALVLLAACFSDPPPLGDDDGSDGETTASTTSVSSTLDGTSAETSTAGTVTTTVDPDTATGDVTTTDTGEPCGEMGTCAPPIPPGWAGPLVVAAGPNDPAACPAGWPRSYLVAHRDLDAPPANCMCECTPEPSNCTASLGGSVTAGCDPLVNLGQAVGGACSEAPKAGYLAILPNVADATGVCTDMDLVVVDPPSWGTTLSLCAAPRNAPSCGDGLCVLPIDPPFAERLCVAREGVFDCPAGPFTESTIAFVGADDTRNCSGCSCGAATGLMCDGGATVFEIHDTADCSAEPTSVEIDGTCIDLPNGTQAVRYVPGNPGSCGIATQSMPIGGAVPIGEVSICCTP